MQLGTEPGEWLMSIQSGRLPQGGHDVGRQISSECLTNMLLWYWMANPRQLIQLPPGRRGKASLPGDSFEKGTVLSDNIGAVI